MRSWCMHIWWNYSGIQNNCMDQDVAQVLKRPLPITDPWVDCRFTYIYHRYGTIHGGKYISFIASQPTPPYEPLPRNKG